MWELGFVAGSSALSLANMVIKGVTPDSPSSCVTLGIEISARAVETVVLICWDIDNGRQMCFQIAGCFHGGHMRHLV
jgi:hypothetical protein